MEPEMPQETHRLSPMRGLHVNRIESLTDGVFAIAMTILIFNLKSSASGQGDSGALLAYLESITGNFTVYIISFFLLGAFWFRYHKQLHRIVRTDDGLVWLNICFLFTVTLVPYTAYVYGAYLGVPLASMIYCANIIAVGLFQLLHWQRALRGDMLDPRVTPEERTATTARMMTVLGCYVLAFAIAIFNPYFFFLAYWAIPIALIIANRVVRRPYA
ncbi:MAG TPA: TMEM175 family protein [Candidatus Eremiobacteraceae bacterium]|jgi:uncharacterized membrane protein